MNIFKSFRKDSHETFTASISTKTPTELLLIKRNLKVSNVANKEAKIFLVEKKLLSAKR